MKNIVTIFKNLFHRRAPSSEFKGFDYLDGIQPKLPEIDWHSHFAVQAERHLLLLLNSLVRIRYGDDAWISRPFDRDIYEIKRQKEVIATFRCSEIVEKLLAE